MLNEKKKVTKEKKKKEKETKDIMTVSVSKAEDDNIALNRVIYFPSENVNFESCQEVIDKILALNSMDSTRPITLIIRSIGGDVTEAMALTDIMELVEAPIRTIGLGYIYSAATFIVAHGEPGMRYLTPSTDVLLHPVRTGVGFGTYEELGVNMDHFKHIEKLYMDKLIKRSTKKGKKSEIKKLTKKESYMTAEKFIDLGFADHIVNTKSLAKIFGNIPKRVTKEYKDMWKVGKLK